MLVSVHGDAPVVISVPHDGKERIDGAPIRAETKRWLDMGGPDPRDENTLPIGRALREALLALKLAPSLIGSLLHRSHMDANRAPTNEPFVGECAGLYREYHARLRGMIAQALATHHRCLLIDLHGFLKPPGADMYDVILGTNEHRTSPHGCDRMFGRSLAQSLNVTFSPDPTRGVNGRYSGGYIVRSMAERWKDDRVDAIQVELAAHIRLRTPHAHIAEHLAHATVQALSIL